MGKVWPSLAEVFIDDYLTPTGASAGGVEGFAATMGWAALAGGYVGSSSLLGQNFASATNSQNENANYGLRTRLELEPGALGDNSAAGYYLASAVSGTSLSTYTASSGTNPNPRCGSQNVVPLASSTSDYREVGLSFRGSDRKLYNAIWFGDN